MTKKMSVGVNKNKKKWKMLKVKPALWILWALFIGQNSYCQGSWNIQYVPTDNIDSSMIDKEIRLDFRKSSKDTLESKTERSYKVRNLLAQEDTIRLEILGEEIRFLEKWRLYADQGHVQDQYLESLDGFDYKGVTIKKMILKKISNNVIYVDADVFKDGQSHTLEIVIGRGIIKGLLVEFR